MPATLLKIYGQNPSLQKIERVVESLKNGGIIIYPTDTIYGLGCDLMNKKAVEKICRIKQIKPHKMNLSFICQDLGNISEYVRNIPTPLFKVMKNCLPGPYTFILNSRSTVPKILGVNKKTVGIRIPDNVVVRELVAHLGNPILNTSLKGADPIVEYTTDPNVIFEKFKHLVNIVIDGGPGGNIPSTVIDCTKDEYVVIREGLGSIENL